MDAPSLPTSPPIHFPGPRCGAQIPLGLCPMHPHPLALSFLSPCRASAPRWSPPVPASAGSVPGWVAPSWAAWRASLTYGSAEQSTWTGATTPCTASARRGVCSASSCILQPLPVNVSGEAERVMWLSCPGWHTTSHPGAACGKEGLPLVKGKGGERPRSSTSGAPSHHHNVCRTHVLTCLGPRKRGQGAI